MQFKKPQILQLASQTIMGGQQRECLYMYSKKVETNFADGELNPNFPLIRSLFSKKFGTTVHIQNYVVTKTDDLQVNAVPAYGLVFQIGWFTPREIVIDHGGYVYEISYNLWKQEDMFKQLLSTFTFTK